MLPVLLRVMSRYAPYVTLPIAAVIGVIGYNIESLISDRYTPYQESITERRNERMLDSKEDSVGSLKEKNSMMSGVLERNLSPSLQGKEDSTSR